MTKSDRQEQKEIGAMLEELELPQEQLLEMILELQEDMKTAPKEITEKEIKSQIKKTRRTANKTLN